MDIEIKINLGLTTVEYKYPNFSICLYPYICSLLSGIPEPSEHAQAIWVAKEQLPTYNWAEADIPVVREYLTINCRVEKTSRQREK